MKGNVLITGGTGFIGAHLMQVVTSAGYSVSSISRGFIDAENYNSLDLTSISQVKNFIRTSKPFDIIIHCAAIAHNETPPNSQKVSEFNSLIIKNLVNAFCDRQPHWIFLSSISVYGERYLDSLVTIDISPVPSDDYGKGKLNDERALSNVCSHLDIVRLVPTYDSDHSKDIRKRVFIPGTGIKLRILPSPSYSFCHVKGVRFFLLRCWVDSPGFRLF